jgi:hypothetical protein
VRRLNALPQIPSCALTEDGLREQRDRYARLGPDTRRVERQADALIIEFEEGFDRAALDEALAVERECCPFFRFAYDDHARRLVVTVREPEELPALEAIAYAVGGYRQLGAG